MLLTATIPFLLSSIFNYSLQEFEVEQMAQGLVVSLWLVTVP